MGRIQGKTAIVLGVAPGNMGVAIARRFVQEGAQVMIAGRRPEPLQQLAAGAQGGALRRSDHGTDSRVRFEKAFGEQRSDDFVRGVGVDVLFAAEDSHRRKGVSRAELAGYDRTLGRVDYLLEYGNAGPKLDAEWCHSCTITDSTASLQDKFLK